MFEYLTVKVGVWCKELVQRSFLVPGLSPEIPFLSREEAIVGQQLTAVARRQDDFEMGVVPSQYSRALFSE